MTSHKWFLHPIFIFVLSIVALGTSLFLYIYWYIEASAGLRELVENLNLDSDQVLTAQTWVVIMVLSVLVGIILLGIFGTFVYGQKALQLYRLQNNFISNFTHELKTPVTSLKLFLQTFAKHKLSREDQLKYLQFMIADVEHLTDNINRILNLARIESKSYRHEFVETDIVEASRNFLDNNKHLFQQARITLHAPGQDLSGYRINTALFEMLLMNLLTNAIKYNASEQVCVDIRFEKTRRKLYIHFADNGIGLESRERRKIFRKFYQVGQSDDMTARGSGLGLYVVQTIAHLHKWKVTAFSEGLNRGTIFSVALPRP